MAVSMAVMPPERVTFAHIPDIRPMPNLIQLQLDSFEWFKQKACASFLRNLPDRRLHQQKP